MARPVLLLLPSPSTRDNWFLWRGRSLAGIRQHNSVEISANDPRILPCVYRGVTQLYLHKEALVTHGATEACWLILKLLIWCKRKFSPFTGEPDLVARSRMRNGEQRKQIPRK